ncbi:MAG: hypothetical protein ACRC8M_04585, partial [Cetobacterium sp.]|uniref:hypothetical protein n=1 Tax=Cetobacterium sp. TaxID=2071632 RepID=UPI003F34BE64
MNIEINLKKELLENYKKEMNINKIVYRTADDDSIFCQYLNYCRKRKIPKISNVYMNTQPFIFYKYQKQIEEIANSLILGKDLTYRLSKTSKNADRIDQLLTYFNIYHFHLGDKIEHLDDEFSTRTGNLLFVYINNKSEAFILGVYPHKDWVKDKWFNILYLNWPEECKPFQLNG